MDVQKDSKGNSFISLNNIRITRIKKTFEPDFSGVRIQAYRNGDNNALHRGAEIPIKNSREALRLIEALAQLL